MKMLYCVFILLIACSNNGHRSDLVKDVAKNKPKADTTIDPITFRQAFIFDTTWLNNKNILRRYLLDSFSQELGNLPMRQIDEINLQKGNIPVEKFGTCDVYGIKLGGDLAGLATDSMLLVVSKTLERSILLPFETIHLIKVVPTDPDYLLAGVYEVRGKGYFSIYRFDGKNGFRQIFDSYQTSSCKYGIPVMNATDDCISYNPFFLNFSNEDFNKDGTLDLIFTGKVLYFCKGLEFGYGRKDRKPLKEHSIVVKYATRIYADSISWTLTDSNVCRLLIQK